MSSIVFYASTAGNAEAAAGYIASKIGGKAVPIASASSEDISQADTVVFGSRVHAGGVHRDIRNYIESNRDALASKRTAYFLTCLFRDERGDRQCADIGKALGIETGAYFVGAKKAVASGDTSELDAFVSKLV